MGSNNNDDIQQDPKLAKVVFTEISPLVSYAGEGLDFVEGKRLVTPVHLTQASVLYFISSFLSALYSYSIPLQQQSSILLPFQLCLMYYPRDDVAKGRYWRCIAQSILI